MSPLNLLALVRRMCAPVSGALGAVGLAFAATPAPVAGAPGVYALMEQAGEIAPANLGRIGNGHVRTLLAVGVGLAELPARCDLPEFAAWDGYTVLHVQNANRAYLRMERDSFND